ncbi:MAG: hypothetical protein K8T20_11915 [Planctomycetes bacterium]|nr:hypothetical protein [Planctomycetota bacterium]
MFQKYKDTVSFLFVYIQDVHTADGWQVPENESEGIVYDQPADWAARQSRAKQCCESQDLTMPCAVDTMENSVDNLYCGFPDRMFVIGGDGKVAYAGKQGPWGFKPEEAEKVLKDLSAEAQKIAVDSPAQR